MSSANDFDFLEGKWNSRQRRRTDVFNPQEDGEWYEFPATTTGMKYLNGKILIEHFEGTLPSGEMRQGVTLRTFDEQSQQWSIRWLDNRNPFDFSPLTGTFQDGIGLFFEDTEAPNGQPVRVRFTWDQISEQSARWQQAFSYDGGETWDTNWIAEFSR